MRSAAAAPLSMMLMQRASAAASPAASLSTISSAGSRLLAAAVVSDNDKGMAKAELRPQQADDLAVRHANFGSLDDALIDVLTFAVGGALERIERSAHVGLAARLLVGFEAGDVLGNARHIRPLRRPALQRGVAVLVAID